MSAFYQNLLSEFRRNLEKLKVEGATDLEAHSIASGMLRPEHGSVNQLERYFDSKGEGRW